MLSTRNSLIENLVFHRRKKSFDKTLSYGAHSSFATSDERCLYACHQSAPLISALAMLSFGRCVCGGSEGMSQRWVPSSSVPSCVQLMDLELKSGTATHGITPTFPCLPCGVWVCALQAAGLRFTAFASPFFFNDGGCFCHAN